MVFGFWMFISVFASLIVYFVGKPLVIWLDSRGVNMEEGIGEVIDAYHVIQPPTGSISSGYLYAESVQPEYNPNLDSYGCLVQLPDGYKGDVGLSYKQWSKLTIGQPLCVTFRRCWHLRRICVESSKETA